MSNVQRAFPEFFIETVHQEDEIPEDLNGFDGEELDAVAPYVGAKLSSNFLTGEWRHGTEHMLVFTLADGTSWSTGYRCEHNGDGETSYGARKGLVDCYQVEAVPVTVMEWRAVEAKPIATESATPAADGAE